jgi:polyhydroxyalkanoate synthesis regulator protein
VAVPFLYAYRKAWENGMQPTQPILVKRYAGSRLYDTSKAKYVSLDELRAWKERGIPFEIREAATGEDVSRVLLA